MTLIHRGASLLVGGALLSTTPSIGCYAGRDSPTRLHATFDVPPGWEVLAEEPGYLALRSPAATRDGVGPYVKLEVVPGGIFPGASLDARDHIERLHASRSRDGAGTRWPASELRTLSLGEDIDAYLEISPDNYWLAHGMSDQLSWATNLAYARDGHVINLLLSDRAELYPEELALIARTTRITRE